MRASCYHNMHITETQEMMGKYASEAPLMDDKISEIEWRSEDDEIICLDNLEKIAGMPMTDGEMDHFFSGEMTVREMDGLVNSMRKYAKLLTPEEKAKRRQYYQKNKERLKRKAKKRREQQESGVKMKKKRTGTAASGFSFHAAAPSGPSGSSKKVTFKGPKPSSSRSKFTANNSGQTKNKKNIRTGNYIAR